MNNNKYNIVLITIDCLRPDHMTCYNYQKNTTPFLNELAKRGILFTNAFANGSSTPSSFPSILASIYAFSDPNYPKLSKSVKTISEVLMENHFQTAGFNSNPYLSRYYHYDRGFQHFDDNIAERQKTEKNLNKFKNRIKKLIKRSEKIYKILKKLRSYILSLKNIIKRINPPYKRIDRINKDVIKWFKTKNPSKFFLWIHYMDTHHPFIPSRKTKKFNSYTINHSEKIILKNPKKVKIKALNNIVNLYDASIKEVDHHLELLFSKFQRMNLLKNTLFIITADHGEEFKEHGGFSHQAKMYDELLKIPLIITGPNIIKNSKVHNLVSLIDLSPTILDYLKIPKCENFLGKSFLHLLQQDMNNYGDINHRDCIISQTLTNNGKVSLSLKKGSYLISYRTREWKFNHLDKQKIIYNQILERNKIKISTTNLFKKIL
ncbi:MAG: sulfatase [Candidatus Lokiarchaeota archaeon]